MGVDGDLYNLVLVLHILAVIIGFGGMFIAGFYGNESRRLPADEGLVVAQATMKVSGQVPTVAVFAVPILGILLVLMSDDVWQFSQAWISLSFLLYIAAVGVMHAGRKLQPSVRSAILNLLVVVVVVLMVTKPGA